MIGVVPLLKVAIGGEVGAAKTVEIVESIVIITATIETRPPPVKVGKGATLKKTVEEVRRSRGSHQPSHQGITGVRKRRVGATIGIGVIVTGNETRKGGTPTGGTITETATKIAPRDTQLAKTTRGTTARMVVVSAGISETVSLPPRTAPPKKEPLDKIS